MAAINSMTFDKKPFVSQLTQTKTVTIDSTAVDAGNTGQTHILRAGLVLGYLTAASAYADYAAGAGDGTQTACCILLEDVDLKGGDPSATSVDTPGVVMWIGEAVSAQCILYDAAAKADLEGPKAVNGGIIEFK